MSKQELISKIMDIKDEKLRDDLLRQITIDGNSSSESVVLSELEKLGFDKTSVKEYVGSQASTGIYVGYLVGAIFVVIGTYNFIQGLTPPQNPLLANPAPAWFPLIFVAAGVFAIFNSFRMAKAFKLKK